MSEKKLTGIERELVLKYLIDGNVPVTITPVLEKKDSFSFFLYLSFDIILNYNNILVLIKSIKIN